MFARAGARTPAATALVTVPGLESFLLGECRRLAVEPWAFGDGWALLRGEAPEAVRAAGTLRAVVRLVAPCPAAAVPERLPRARRLWFECQLINGRRRCEALRSAVLRAAGGPAAADPAVDPADADQDLAVVVNRRGEVLAGRPLAWGLDLRRPYRAALLARSLNPAVARALVMASRARAGDTFLDPFCGSGTVLAERALVGPGRILGRDRDPRAVCAARRTLATFPANEDLRVEVALGDARRLELADGEVTAAATNPPYGHRFGQVGANADLYPAALREAARVLAPGARLALLTADLKHLELAAAAVRPSLRECSRTRVYLGGLEPALVVYERRR